MARARSLVRGGLVAGRFESARQVELETCRVVREPEVPLALDRLSQEVDRVRRATGVEREQPVACQ